MIILNKSIIVSLFKTRNNYNTDRRADTNEILRFVDAPIKRKTEILAFLLFQESSRIRKLANPLNVVTLRAISEISESSSFYNPWPRIRKNQRNMLCNFVNRANSESQAKDAIRPIFSGATPQSFTAVKDQPWHDYYWENCSPHERPGWAIFGSRGIGCDWSSPSASRTWWSSSRTQRCRAAVGAPSSPPQCRTRDSPRAAPSSRADDEPHTFVLSRSTTLNLDRAHTDCTIPLPRVPEPRSHCGRMRVKFIAKSAHARSSAGEFWRALCGRVQRWS